MEFQVSPYRMPMECDPDDFIAAFKKRFPDGTATLADLGDMALPGYWGFCLEVPLHQKHELQPFLEEEAQKHGGTNVRSITIFNPFGPVCPPWCHCQRCLCFN